MKIELPKLSKKELNLLNLSLVIHYIELKKLLKKRKKSEFQVDCWKREMKKLEELHKKINNR